MPVTFKREDDLDKMLEEFASFEDLEKIDVAEPPLSADKKEKK